MLRRSELFEVISEVGGRALTLRQNDKRLDEMAAPLVGRGDRRRFAHSRVLDARRLDLEGPDPVAGRDDHVVGAPRVPEVAVGVLLGGVLGVEPLAAEGLLGVLRAVPVTEWIVGI